MNSNAMPVGFVACSCPCGCVLPAPEPVIKSHALLSRVRCKACSTRAHVNNYSSSVEIPEEALGRLTPLHEMSPEEVDAHKKALSEVKQEIWNNAWAKWQESLPEKFRNATTNDPKLLAKLDLIASGHSDIASVLIHGIVGRGKTWTAIGFANTAIQRGLVHPSEVLFGTEADLLASPANESFGNMEQAMQRIVRKRYKIIIIDDVGRGTWLREKLRPLLFMHIIDKQYRENNIVVITTNLNRKALSEQIGAATLDRIFAMTGNSFVALEQDSQRELVTQKSLQQASEKTLEESSEDIY